MLVVRLFGVLALIGIGGSLIAWMLTGNPRYRRWAWNAFLAGLVVIFIFLALLALERVFVPLA
jgi:heme O synthase-like polyprenyltransferase